MEDRCSRSHSPAFFRQTVGQLNRKWFPVEPSVLARISQQFRLGHYQGNRAVLVHDLRSDYSLYLYCLKELSLRRSAACGHAQTLSLREFTTLIETASEEDLEAVLPYSPGVVSSHNLMEISRSQAQRLEECVLSTTTIARLSESFGLSAVEGYQCSLLRQLGFILVAWNFPDVYAKGLKILEESFVSGGADLEVVLHALMGYSPSMLAAKAVQDWGVSEQVTKPIQLNLTAPPDHKVSGRPSRTNMSTVLAQLIGVGEALARAAHPELYPHAQRDWDRAEEVIRTHLGPDGISQVFQEAEALCAQYEKIAPELFTLTERALHSAQDFHSERARRRFSRNVHLRKCPVEIREKVESVYASLTETVDDRLVKKFFYEVAPSIGVDFCAVFMIDAARNSLVPTFTAGTPKFVKRRPVPLMDESGISHPIREALHLRRPVIGEGFVEQRRTDFFAAPFGSTKALGVVYFELSAFSSEAVRECVTQLFLALHQCLQDLLRLE